jgi:hypothetical protein
MHHRHSRGNVLILVIAVMCFIVLPVAFFTQQFVRTTGSQQEQRTAIEAASMAVAKDLQRIVIDDPNFGLISLSDCPPVGKDTKAQDNWFCNVRGINTVLGTIRLDMIISDQLNSTIMRLACDRDYTNAMAAKNRLVTLLQASIKPGGGGQDIDGNPVNPYDDAVAAYESNLIRMEGGKSTLVANSLKITLGWEDELYTNTVVPYPASIASLTVAQRNQNCYKSFVDCPYTFKGTPYTKRDFVFAAIDTDVRLVDWRTFQTGNGSMPYVIPSIVKCEADQQYTTVQPASGKETHTIHCVACAEPASLGDHLPAPGALAIDFPMGTVTGINSLMDIFCSNQVMKSPTDLLLTPPNGDSPPGGLVQISPPPLNTVVAPPNNVLHPPFGYVLALAVYDWFRQAGTNVNVASLINAFTLPFVPGIPANLPQIQQYQFDLSGNIQQSVQPYGKGITRPVSDKQLYSRSGLVYLGPPTLPPANRSIYDVYVKDFVYQPGRINGGKHAGEVPGDPIPPFNNGPPDPYGREIDELTNAGTFPSGPPGGAVRPTYQQKTGISVDILFRVRTVQMPP